MMWSHTVNGQSKWSTPVLRATVIATAVMMTSGSAFTARAETATGEHERNVRERAASTTPAELGRAETMGSDAELNRRAGELDAAGEIERYELDLAKDCTLGGENGEPLVADDTLELQVREAINNDPRLQDSRIEVRLVHDGEVRIDGEVPDLTAHKHVLEAIHAVEGVCKVLSDVEEHDEPRGSSAG